MKEFENVLGFIEHLVKLEAATHVTMRHALSEVGALLEKDMREQIGDYQGKAGPYIAWAPLTPATEEIKARLGAPADAPLYRYGDLQKSFKHEVDGDDVIVGSTDPVMVYHEFGTSRMPPRPVVGPALYKHRVRIQEILGRALVEGIIGGRLASELLPLPKASL
jgi:phage gpG-like protein